VTRHRAANRKETTVAHPVIPADICSADHDATRVPTASPSTSRY